MDLGFLDKSSNVTPLLVRLYDNQKLYGLAKDREPQARLELTNAVCELMEMNLSQKESELVADVLIGLLRQVEIELREAIAERLSVMKDVPLRLILQMANDEIRVAGPVLKHSMILSDLDLIYIIKAKDASYWKAIAQRRRMSDKVVDILSETNDVGTVTTLLENQNIRLTAYALDNIKTLAVKEQKLARPLLQRSECTDDLAAYLYRYVGEEIKSYIIRHYTVDPQHFAKLVDDAVQEKVQQLDLTSEYLPSEAMMKAARRFKDQGQLTVKLMLQALRRGHVQAFIAQFSEFIGVKPKITEDILKQHNGQALAIACKAHKISKEDFIAIYLLTNPVRRQGQMVDLEDMGKAVSYFNRISYEMACNILKTSIKTNKAD